MLRFIKYYAEVTKDDFIILVKGKVRAGVGGMEGVEGYVYERGCLLGGVRVFACL